METLGEEMIIKTEHGWRRIGGYAPAMTYTKAMPDAPIRELAFVQDQDMTLLEINAEYVEYDLHKINTPTGVNMKGKKHHA